MVEDGFAFLELAFDVREDVPDDLSGVSTFLMRGQDLLRNMARQRRAVQLMRSLFLKHDVARRRIASEARQLALQPVEELLEQLPNMRARSDVLQFNDAFHAAHTPSYAVFLDGTTIVTRRAWAS